MASEDLKQEIQQALDNATLSRTLGTFCRTYPAKREKSYEGVDFPAVRDKIKEVKSFAADHVDELIEEFTRNCEARGGHVIHARSTEEAMEFIRKLVKEKEIKSIVKSKSMASEELHFNKVLGDDGVLVQETDLGEFIIALEGNTPVHMVMPALHLNKEEVADLFTEYTKEKNGSHYCRGGQDGPEGYAGPVHSRGHGRFRGECGCSGNGYGLYHDQRGKRAHGGHSAENPSVYLRH